MNILFLNTTYLCGGAETVTNQIFQGMRLRDHCVYEIVSDHKRPETLPNGITALYGAKPLLMLNRIMTHNHGNDSLTIPYSLQKISSFIKEKHIDIVHLHNAHGNFLGIRDIRQISTLCPIVWTLHDFWAVTGHCTYPTGCPDLWISGCHTCPSLDNYPPLRTDKASLLWDEKKKAFQDAKILYTVPSHWMEAQFKKSYLARKNCICIPNSLNPDIWKLYNKNELREQYGIPAGKHILAFIAADPLKKLKGMELLLEALKLLPDPENYLLLIAGRKDGLDRIQGKGFSVRHFGYITDQEKMNEFYSLADVLVNPSLYETFGLVNIEAMICQTPVIAFSICAMEEILADTGWCIPEISSNALAQTIQKAVSSPELLHSKSKASRSRIINHFSENQMLNSFEAAYQKAMAIF